MKNALILQPFEGVDLGLYEHTLTEEGVSRHIVRLGDTMPDIEDFDAVLMSGGPQSVNDPEIAEMVEAVGYAIHLGKHFFGVCQGLQAGVKAMGGEVVAAKPPEYGLYDSNGNRLVIRQTAAGKKSPLLEGIPERFGTFQVHNETVVLTDDMVSLAKSNGMHQIVQIATRAYGVQFHVEPLLKDVLDDWAVKAPGLKDMDYDKLSCDFTDAYPRHRRIARQLMLGFIGIVRSDLDLAA